MAYQSYHPSYYHHQDAAVLSQPQTQRSRSDSRDSFSGRFSDYAAPEASTSGMGTMPAMHPSALQSGSSRFLPPSTQLRADRLDAIGSELGPGRSTYDDEASITPYDSISNVGDRQERVLRGRRGSASFAAARNDYLVHDPYAPSMIPQPQLRHDSPSSKMYSTRPISNAGRQLPQRDSTGELPLMPYDGGYDSDSVMEGDTVVQGDSRSKRVRKNYKQRPLNSDEVERGILSESYPPPRYDTPEEKNGEDPFADPVGQAADGLYDGTATEEAKRKGKSGKRPNVWIRQFRDTTPIEDKIKNHKRGIGIQARPWACWVIATVLVIVFIVELVKSAQKTGKAIATSPFNYMIGPSSEMLINLGARFTACMRSVPEITNTPFLCLDDAGSSASSATRTCTLEEICGFGGFGPDGVPHQTFRFFTPLWLHVGVVHLVINGLVLLASSALVEKQMGTLKFLILYMISGVFGFILGANFSLVGLASMGASGALFGTHSAALVDLIWHWKLFDKPGRMLIALIFEIVVGFGLGFIPGIDNFAHIGGFAIGLLLAIVLVPAIHLSSSHRIGIYCARLFAFIGACVMFGVLLNNFYTSDPNNACHWCRYLSCWPTNANNRCKGTGLTMQDTSSSASNDGTVGSQTNSNVSLALMSLLTVLVTKYIYRDRASR